MLMNLYGYYKEYYATLNNDIMQDYWHILILPQKKECCRQCRHVMFKGIMTKRPVQKQTHWTAQEHVNTQQTFRKKLNFLNSAAVPPGSVVWARWCCTRKSHSQWRGLQHARGTSSTDLPAHRTSMTGRTSGLYGPVAPESRMTVVWPMSIWFKFCM